MRLKDKVIIVTGGSGLLGRAFVEQLKSEGGIVINADVACRTDLSVGEFQCDATSDESTTKLVDAVFKKYGRIDGLVNNAYPRTKDWGTIFENVSEESWRLNIDMQMNSYIFLSRKVMEKMVPAKSGSIVNIASIYGVVGPDFTVYEGTALTNAPAYAAIKGGLINMTRYLASYYGKHNIRINCVSPGGIFDNQNPVFVANYEKKVPLKRMGTAKDIAPSVSFLLSDDASYITGHNLMVDGGWTSI